MSDKCAVCWAETNDKRIMKIDWLCDVKEYIPECHSFMSKPFNPSSTYSNARLIYTMSTCKKCRAEVLEAMKEAIDERRMERHYELDNDGERITIDKISIVSEMLDGEGFEIN